MSFLIPALAVFSAVIVAFPSSSFVFCEPQAIPNAPEQSVYNDSEGYEVLSLLLNQATSKARLSTIDISVITARGEEVLDSAKCLKVPEEFQSAAKDFKEKNKSRLRLTDKFSLKVEHVLAEKPDVQPPPPAAPGEQQLEGTLVGRVLFAVSAVGFDQTKTHAIAYVSAYCGDMCAGGAYHLLIKDKQAWKEATGSPKCEWIAQAQDSIPTFSWPR